MPIPTETHARAPHDQDYTHHTPIDPDRHLWLAATSAAGGAGRVATAVSFVSSMAPSERARALGAPIEAELQGLRPGELPAVEWRGQPVFALRRSPAMLELLTRHGDLLSDRASRRSDQPTVRRQCEPFRQVGDRGAGRRLHASRLHSHLPADTGRGRYRGFLAWRFQLPLTWLQVRRRRAHLQKRTRADRSRHAALPLRL